MSMRTPAETLVTYVDDLTEVSTDARPAARWLNQRYSLRVRHAHVEQHHRRLSRDGLPRHEADRNARRNPGDLGHLLSLVDPITIV
jgi:hypothetical protein